MRSQDVFGEKPLGQQGQQPTRSVGEAPKNDSDKYGRCQRHYKQSLHVDDECVIHGHIRLRKNHAPFTFEFRPATSPGALASRLHAERQTLFRCSEGVA